MSFKVLIFLSTMCVVKASIIITIYDDSDNEAVSLSSNCNPQACDQLCRRLGFTGGACVGDRCKCDINFHQRIGADKLYSDSDDEEVSMNNCNSQACDQICRKLGFAGGVCVGDKCNCHSKISKVPSDRYKYKVIQSLECSSDVECAQVCRKVGFPGGACNGDKCDCKKFKTAGEKEKTPFERFWQSLSKSDNFEENLIEPQQKLATCNDATCNTQCILIGYQRGMCYVGYCQCF